MHHESCPSDHEKWQRGPLPPDTWNYGGVVPVGDDLHGGLYFADFKGDHVLAIGADKGADRIIKAEDVAWFNIKKLPKLGFDHRKIIDAAIKRLRGKITYEPVGFELLEKEFPFSDLEKLYQTLLDQEIDRRNFKKKIVGLGILEELDETIQRKSGRPARLFKFNKKKYFELKEKGYNFDIFF